MKDTRRAAPKVGDRLGPNLTVLGIVDGGAREPVVIVWHGKSWCPMACKIFPSTRRADEEAGVLAALSHPYIVTSLGVENPGCLLMPYLEGLSLASMIDEAPKHRLTLSNAMRVGLHIGAALNHVHARGFLHMDVKPSNVIVAAGGRPILFDFGSARRIGAERPKSIIGTNTYIAPEECNLGEAGPPADVFSLAVVLYEMLAGEIPFGRETAKTPFPQLVGKVMPLRDRRRDVPEALENLLYACLEKKPEFRPTLDELLPALNDAITGGPKMWPDDFSPVPGRAPAKKANVRRRTSLRSLEAAPYHRC